VADPSRSILPRDCCRDGARACLRCGDAAHGGVRGRVGAWW
jgi:hypothetical protein